MIFEVGDTTVDITLLNEIELVYILWKKTKFPSSVTVLYNENACYHLSIEELNSYLIDNKQIN